MEGDSPSLEDELKRLYPGTFVPIGASGVRVYPVGIVQIGRFTKGMASVVAKLAGLRLRKNADGTVEWGSMAPVVAPVLVEAVTGDLLELVLDCVTPDIRKLRVPHFVMADVILAWCMENFGEENKLRPWVQAAEAILGKALGQSVELWDPLSKAFSPAAIASMKSSIAGKLASHTTAGQSSSSTTGPEPSAPSEPSSSSTSGQQS